MNPVPATDNITLAILAGGMGRRMGGVDKGLVEVLGRPMIAWTLDAVRPQAGHLLINANRSQADYASFGLPVIGDRHEGFQGPLAGLHAVLEAAATPYVAIVPCDTPRLPRDLVARLARALIEEDAELAVAEAAGRVHTLHGLFRSDLLPDLTRALEAGERKPDAWYATRRWSRVDFSDAPQAFDNINTPEQRDALAEQL
ncbi:molybdenum cofactor guanylyltransferase MobA [Wenzhouxiangella limi]|uniref:Molybdenum cofactor guanylyltransferase n=1 Tax=Wenzhouxiangella limi TaxID=2707351 RepID=A0A845UY54_9GAMM|nr:molybdenum cofactor guanylyltransferase MobA [Wenzhouxiangella limi]NDY95638.1 molybdenum cofactor guanylyltransferase [Wenzhouxiangella limi]